MAAHQELIERSFAESRVVADAALRTLAQPLARAAEVMIAAYRAGGKVLFCGNGGSAADAEHLAAEFTGRFLRDRRPLPALALHSNTTGLTAIGNDYGMDETFARVLQAFAQPGDVLVGLSTSGNSRNVVAAFARARKLGTPTIALTGASGGELRDFADTLLNVPSVATPRIQECHILLGHILCEAVERALFPA